LEKDLKVCEPLGPFHHSGLFLSSSVHWQLREAVSGNNFLTMHVELSTAMVSGINDEILERVIVREMLRLQFLLMSQESLQRLTEPLNLFWFRRNVQDLLTTIEERGLKVGRHSSEGAITKYRHILLGQYLRNFFNYYLVFMGR
jgi:hypothetical protein